MVHYCFLAHFKTNIWIPEMCMYKSAFKIQPWTKTIFQNKKFSSRHWKTCFAIIFFRNIRHELYSNICSALTKKTNWQMPLTCEYLRFLPGFLCVDLPTFSVTSKKFLTRLIERCFRARYSLASRALSNASGFCSTNPCTHRFNCTSKGIGAKAPFLFYVAHLIRKRTVLTSFSPCVSQFSNYIAP